MKWTGPNQEAAAANGEKTVGVKGFFVPAGRRRAPRGWALGHTLTGAQGRPVCSARCRLPEKRCFYMLVLFKGRQPTAWKVL